MELPVNLKLKKNIFIYFDYEREFGNKLASITDENIHTLLKILDKYKLRTTWFTVGKIFKYYNNSISMILDYGHEIASHTYAHIAPFNMNGKQQLKDFEKYDIHSRKVTNIKGFHSPNGRWDLKMFKLLCKHRYNYDLASIYKSSAINPLLVDNCKDNYILRLFTLGDDWPYYIGNYSEDEISKELEILVQQILPGTLAGIGFHPWILFSKGEILHSFTRLLEYLQNQQEYNIMNAGWFAKEILKNTQLKQSE